MPKHHHCHRPDPTPRILPADRPGPQRLARTDGDAESKRRLSPSTTSPFTCTFCWCTSRGPALVLGSIRSSAPRLACGPCHAAVLNLAVCWVCGELVCRGDECVSLGWCFVGFSSPSSSSTPTPTSGTLSAVD